MAKCKLSVEGSVQAPQALPALHERQGCAEAEQALGPDSHDWASYWTEEKGPLLSPVAGLGHQGRKLWGGAHFQGRASAGTDEGPYALVLSIKLIQKICGGSSRKKHCPVEVKSL